MELLDFTGFIRTRHLLEDSETVILAVSGGIDSVVMAHLFQRSGYRFAIAHCNFGLRGADSDGDEEFTRRLAAGYRVPFFLKRFDTTACARQQGLSIQMAARELRYAWFEDIRKNNGFQAIATAHHLDDQAETFLINLIRGTGIAGLHGIPLRNGCVIRPMLFATRRDILDYAGEHRLAFREDHSNSELKYLRNRIRHEVIPLLATINPDFTTGLAGSILRLADFEEAGNHALDEWCKENVCISGAGFSVPVAPLLQLARPAPYLWKVIAPLGFNETQANGILAATGARERKTFLSPAYRAVIERDQILITQKKKASEKQSYRIGEFIRKKTLLNPFTMVFERLPATGYGIPAAGTIASLDASAIRFPLTLRKWQHGDSFYPLGMRKRKKLSDFFTDLKFTLQQREDTWLLCSGDAILWIVGYRIDNRYRVTSSTRAVLRITVGGITPDE